MAKGKGDLDLMVALGVPDAPKDKSKGDKKPKGLLAGKAPQLVAFLTDAVDSSLSKEERAEALCQAIEFTGEAEEVPEEEMIEESDGDSLGGYGS